MTFFSHFRTHRCVWAGYGLLFAILFLWQIRILTYVSAQDPSQIYIPMAWDLVEANWSLDAIKEVSQHVIPGWPLFLSVVIKVFGRYAPYWVNLVFCFSFFWMLGELLHRALRDRLDAFVALFFSLALTIGTGETIGTADFSLCPHYLLYAFRDLPTMFFIMAALYFFTRAKGRSMAILGGLCWVLAMGMKEVALAAIPVFACYGFLHKRKQVGWFFLPLLIAGGCALAWVLSGHSFASQAQRVFRVLGDVPAAKARALFQVLLDFSWFIFFVGWFFFELGLRYARKHPSLLAIPGIGGCIALAYVMGLPYYPMHERYELSAFLWCLPLVGVGVLQFLGAWEEKRPTWPYRKMALALCVFLLVVRAFFVGDWDPPVSRAEVDTFRKAFKQYVPKDAAIIISPAYRMATGALDGFTHTQRPDPYTFKDQVDAETPVFFMDSKSKEALHPNSRHAWGMKPREVVLADYDLEHRSDLQIAGESYRLFALAPRTQHERVMMIQYPDRFKTFLLWLDVRNSTPVTLDWEGQGSYTLDRKLSCLVLPRDPAVYPLRWTFRSEQGLPKHLVHRSESLESVSVWPLTKRARSLSSLEWFEPPFMHLSPVLFNGIACRGEGWFQVPIPLNALPSRVEVEFACSLKHRHQIQVFHDGERLFEGAKSEGQDELRIPLYLSGPFPEVPRLRFVVTGIAIPRDLLYLDQLKLRYFFDHGNGSKHPTGK